MKKLILVIMIASLSYGYEGYVTQEEGNLLLDEIERNQQEMSELKETIKKLKDSEDNTSFVNKKVLSEQIKEDRINKLKEKLSKTDR